MSDPSTEQLVHHVFDCSTGEVQQIPLTDEEIAAMLEQEKKNQQALEDQAAEDAALIEAVKSSTDPAVQLLAKRFGIQID